MHFFAEFWANYGHLFLMIFTANWVNFGAFRKCNNFSSGKSEFLILTYQSTYFIGSWFQWTTFNIKY